MSVPSVSVEEQKVIAQKYVDGDSLEELSYQHNISPTTVRRVLAEQHVLKKQVTFHKTDDEVAMLNYLSIHGIKTVNELRVKL